MRWTGLIGASVMLVALCGLVALGCGKSSSGGGGAPPSSFQIATTSLPSGSVGTVHTSTLTTTNGAAPFTWAVVQGAPPSGLSLNPTTGVLDGTPTMTGSSTLIVRVTDGTGQQAERSFTVLIGSEQVEWTSVPMPPNGSVGASYTFDLTPFVAKGTQPYTFSISQGRLPTDLVLNTSGTVSGTPSAAESQQIAITVSSAPDPVTGAISAKTQTMTFTVDP